MALQSGLSLYCYSLAPSNPSGTTGVVIDYSNAVENLQFTTVSPGGYGQCTFMLKVTDARLYRAELQLFAHVAIMSQLQPVWLGEITNVQLDLLNEDQDGERYNVTALGVGNALRDDPANATYVGQTIAQIISNQLAFRANYNMPISQDMSAVVPQNPATTYSPAYSNDTIEEVISALASYDGDDDWGVVAHPLASQPNGTAYQDAAGFPLGQVYLKARDKTTTHYIASTLLQEVTDHSVTPSADRAYNVIYIGYNDPTATPPVGEAVATDSRLAGSGAQQNAPFRRRKYVRDLSSLTTVTAGLAATIANTYLTQFQNVSNKVQIHLVGARDYTSGRQLQPWMITAGKNIAILELTPRGMTLATTPTPGVNQFYIVQSSYAEDQNGNAIVTLDCDNYTDDAAILIAQLQIQADEENRSQRTTGSVQASGAADRGACGLKYVASGATDIRDYGVNFHAVMVNTPTSITLSSRNVTNVGSITALRISQYGCAFQVTPSGAGTCEWWGDYVTVGNCLLAVDSQQGTYDHHCDLCGTVSRGTALATLASSVVNGAATLNHTCLNCGAVECFNAALTAADAAAASWRGQQATLIRAALTALSLPLIGNVVHIGL